MYQNGIDGIDGIENGFKNPFSLERVTNPNDKKFYEHIVQYCSENNIEYDESNGIVFDLAAKYGMDIFQKIALSNGYKPHNCKNCHNHEDRRGMVDLKTDITKAFILDFGNWIWNYNNERDITIRRVWYLKYKQLVQILYLETYNGKGDFNKRFSDLLSSVLWDLIQNNPELYYGNFSIKDISRSIWSHERLGWSNIVVFGEKDATTPYFQKTCEILGIQVLVSGSGKSSTAATEKIFTDMVNNKFDRETPILLLTLTDWDNDGLVGVESGFVKQVKIYAERFDYEVIHKRIGVFPDDIPLEDRTPTGSCFVLPKQNNEWAKKYGIPFERPDGTVFLGIELEALPTSYYFKKILQACYDFFTQEEMSDYVRMMFTPTEWSYENTVYELSKEIAEDLSYEYKELNLKLNVLLKEQDRLEKQKEDIVEPIKNRLWEETNFIIREEKWDDRQRKWDDTTDTWDKESIENMLNEHKKNIEISVISQTPFVNYTKGLGFSNEQLLEKYQNYVKDQLNDQIEINDLITIQEIEEKEQEYDVFVLKREGNEEKTINELYKNKTIKSLFNSLKILVNALSELDNEEEIAEQIPDEDFELLSKFMEIEQEEEEE